MRDIYLISDTHFGHANIIKYCNRPFTSAEEMDAAMVERWNRTVRPQDHIYHLGDVAMGQAALHRVMPQLNGHKRLLLGNHDNQAPMKDYARYFDKILVWRLFKPVIFTHVPIHQGSFGKATVNAHGHVHNSPSPSGPYINLSCEMWDYTPVHLDVILQLARDRGE